MSKGSSFEPNHQAEERKGRRRSRSEEGEERRSWRRSGRGK